MPRNFQTRASIFIILIAVSIGMISLGMRLPSLSGLSSSSGKPKPRPRAIVQNQIKQCKQQTVHTSPPALATIDEFTISISPQESATFNPWPPTSPCRSIKIRKASRAPPVFA